MSRNSHHSLGPLGLLLFAAAFLLLVVQARAQVPSLLNYQGRVVVNNVNFDGVGSFRFALVNGDASVTYWSNDGTSVAGAEPTAAVTLAVDKGLYSVLLGDTNLAHMTAVPATVFENPEVWLRVWFDDGSNGSLLLAPDQRIASVGYAMVADSASQILLSKVLAPALEPVLAWGRNQSGQLTVPSPLSGVDAVSAGGAHSLALLSDGTVEAWGDDSAGQATVPGSLASVTQISAGVSHSLARKSDGTVEAWGDDSQSQSTVPGGLSNVSQVAAGGNHSMALKGDGTVEVWGDATFTQTTVPGGATGVTQIAAGTDHCLARKSDGTVEAWGRNDTNQTTLPGGLANVVAVAAGTFHSLALKGDGTVEAWGLNSAGQTDVPPGLVDVVAVVGGNTFSAALKSDGTVVVWGDDSYGQSPVPDGVDQIQMLAAGSDHLLALQNDLIPAEVARLDQPNVFLEPVGIGRTPAANELEVEGQASKTTAGNWAANSDRRIKMEIEPVSGALELIDRLNPVTFRYTPEYREEHGVIDDVPYYNVIAQEFAEVFPHAVQGSGDRLPDGSEILQVDTYPATITSIAAVKELNEQLKQKEEEIEALTQRLEALERRFNAEETEP